MNATTISLNPEIREAIRCVAKRDWEAFFKSIRESELEAFEQTGPEDLLMVQARVRVLSELKTLFNDIRESAKQ